MISTHVLTIDDVFVIVVVFVPVRNLPNRLISQEPITVSKGIKMNFVNARN
jgi:hypothetical protein